MLSGIGSLLFGTGGAIASGETDNATVDQTPASQPTSLDTQDTDNGWVLVDVADDGEGRAEGDPHCPVERDPAHHPEPAGSEGSETERGNNEQLENRRHQQAAVQHQRNALRAARAMRAAAMEVEQARVIRSVQRKQHMSKTRQLNRKSLEVSNKARTFRKPASAHRRVLCPSGQMNGRQCQRQY